MDIETGNKILHLLREIKQDASASAATGGPVLDPALPEGRLVKLLEEINGEIRVMRKAQIRDSERIQNIEKRLNIINRTQFPGYVPGEANNPAHFTAPKPTVRPPATAPGPRASRVASDVDDIMQMLNHLKSQI